MNLAFRIVNTSLLFSTLAGSPAATTDLGNGFADHGIPAPISCSRGIVATMDGNGRDVVLVWLSDVRGCPALLMIDAENGMSQEYPIPFSSGYDLPFASILSSGNKFYTHFSGHFVEFDPAKRAFTAIKKTIPRMAMSMTEDDHGHIWAASYPNSGLMEFDPASGSFHDFGTVYTQNWCQYQRSIAADDSGWLYFAIGNKYSQIIALNPMTRASNPLFSETNRVANARAYVYRDNNGKVYGISNEEHWDGPWYELQGGRIKMLGTPPPHHEKPIIHGAQDLFHHDFPSGKQLKTLDLSRREMVVSDPHTKTDKILHFNYTTEGESIMTVAASSDGTLCGGTESQVFNYNPKTDQWLYHSGYRQWNTLASQSNLLFIGAYPGGYLLEWDSSRKWNPPERGHKNANPYRLARCSPTIDRPHKLLVYPDDKTLILAGAPDYGYTGGGLLFFNQQTHEPTLLNHTAIIPEHTTMSLVPLPNGKLLGGTSTRPGSGGERKAREAELYIMDISTKNIDWHQAVFPGAQEYSELCMGPDGLIYGLMDFSIWDPARLDYVKRFFVFDPVHKKVVYKTDTERKFGPVSYQQGPRHLLSGPDNKIYILFQNSIAKVNPSNYKLSLLARSPVPIKAGGDILDGRIYFSSGSHLCSFKIPPTAEHSTK